MDRTESELKYYAHNAVTGAIALGKLKKLPCVVCGNPIVHAHHEDYSKPFEITWLCSKHHGKRHSELRGFSDTNILGIEIQK